MELARSRHYIIRNEYEYVYLYDAETDRKIARVARFFRDDPAAAKITDDERYCIITGFGAVVYKLQEPFADFMPGGKCIQWQKYCVDEDIWFEEILELTPKYAVLLAESGEKHRINIYI